MKKYAVKVLDLPSTGNTAVLLILSLCFLLGVLAGCLLANQVAGEGNKALLTYLNGFFHAIQAESRPDFFSLLWNTLRWPLFAVGLGLSAIGLIGIPILFLTRGFLMAFSVASIFSVLGPDGLWLSFILFGISGLISIPALFVVGSQCFLTAGSAAGYVLGEGRVRPLFDKSVILNICICAGAFLVCVLIEYSLLPSLLSSVSGLL